MRRVRDAGGSLGAHVAGERHLDTLGACEASTAAGAGAAVDTAEHGTVEQEEGEAAGADAGGAAACVAGGGAVRASHVHAAPLAGGAMDDDEDEAIIFWHMRCGGRSMSALG